MCTFVEVVVVVVSKERVLTSEWRVATSRLFIIIMTNEDEIDT